MDQSMSVSISSSSFASAFFFSSFCFCFISSGVISLCNLAILFFSASSASFLRLSAASYSFFFWASISYCFFSSSAFFCSARAWAFLAFSSGSIVSDSYSKSSKSLTSSNPIVWSSISSAWASFDLDGPLPPWSFMSSSNIWRSSSFLSRSALIFSSFFYYSCFEVWWESSSSFFSASVFSTTYLFSVDCFLSDFLSSF